MVLYDIDPLDKKLEFHGNFDVIILKGSAVIESNGSSILYEAPRLLSSPYFDSETSFFIEFSTDAKYMCNSLSFEKSNRSGKLIEDNTSFVNLELKQHLIPSRNSHRRHSSFAMEEGQRSLFTTQLRRKSVVGLLRGDDEHLQDDSHLV
jgi:hypothetical protein